MTPAVIDSVTLAFPGNLGALLPAWSDIPEDFRRERDAYSKHVQMWFFKGLTLTDWKVKEGIDADAAWRHLATCLRSFEPKHEHKIAGVAYLMSQWFDRVAA